MWEEIENGDLSLEHGAEELKIQAISKIFGNNPEIVDELDENCDCFACMWANQEKEEHFNDCGDNRFYCEFCPVTVWRKYEKSNVANSCMIFEYGQFRKAKTEEGRKKFAKIIKELEWSKS